MDLFGPSKNKLFDEIFYALIDLDDYSLCKFTLFLSQKRDSFDAFRKLAKIIQNKKGSTITTIWNDHGGEFQNEELEFFVMKMVFNTYFPSTNSLIKRGSREKK